MPKKEQLPESIEKLKTQLEKENNLIDYFLVCGLNPAVCQENTLYDISSRGEIAKKNLTPEILSKFPPFDKTTITVDDGILQYCFQDGFKIFNSEQGIPPEKKIFSFILDNQISSFEYPQKYVTCCLFYESIDNYKRLKNEIDGKKGKGLKKANSLNTQRTISFPFKRNTYHELQMHYIPKCICLISVYPNFQFHHELLSLFKDYGTKGISERLEIPIEKFIQSLIIEVPSPPRGICTIEYPLPNSKAVKELKQSEMNKLPLLDFTLPFHPFEPKDIIEIYKHILFETKLIFFSSNVNDLCYIISGFMNILSPFKYPFQIASNVPKINYSILESICPYIFGIREKFKKTFFVDNGIDVSESSILCIDVDEREVYLNDGANENFPKFPKKFYEKLEKNLYLIKKKKNDEDINSKYLNCFFETNVALFRNYEKYLNNQYYNCKDTIQNTNINTLFKVKEFIESQGSSEKDFFAKIVNDTQMFTEFIYRRMIPKNTAEKIESLFFNEKIAEFNAKSTFFGKKNLNFIISEEYKVKSKYAVAKQKELSKFEEQAFLENKNRDKYLIKGQCITTKDKKIFFSYPVFPMLLQEIFFDDKNISNYNIPPYYAEEIDTINADIVSKSLIAHEEGHRIEMENYIYLTWLELWAFSFWYIDDKKERNYRFNQMINVLDKVIHHEMEIFNLLFDVLSKQNEDDMILNLYKKLINYKLNPSIFIHTIISRLLDRKQIQALIETSQNQTIKVENDYKVQHGKFKKRTFRIFCEKTVLGESVNFTRYYPCFECPEALDLLKISKDFTQIKKDEVWAFCNKCKNYTLPKLIVLLGREINTEGDENGNEGKTSTQCEVVLYSPYNLKVNVKEGISREYGLNLDIDLFKLKFQSLFWNAIWYFSINELDYEFLLPYEEHVFKIQRKLNDEGEKTKMKKKGPKIVDKDKEKEKIKPISKVKISFKKKFTFPKKQEETPKEEAQDKLTKKEKFTNLEISHEYGTDDSQNISFSLPKSFFKRGSLTESLTRNDSFVDSSNILGDSLLDRSNEDSLEGSTDRENKGQEENNEISLIKASTLLYENKKYLEPTMGKIMEEDENSDFYCRRSSIATNRFRNIYEEVIILQEQRKRRKSGGEKANKELYDKCFQKK